MELTWADKQRVIQLLQQTHPNVRSALQFTNPFELLIAVILSAQCTDKRVNQITENLFRRCPTPREILDLGQDKLEQMIRGCGLYHTKAANIMKTCRILIERHGGIVPDTREELESLPGVGRKTANVVLSNAFDQPAIAVDTHVFRVANRLGLTNSTNVAGTEQGLMKAIPQSDWSDAHHWLIWHGRLICKARKPLCSECSLSGYCLYFKQQSVLNK